MHFSYFYLLVDQVRISLCTCLEVACGETTLSFILFFCSKLNGGLYFLSKFIVTSLVANALYCHACSIYDMPCKGRYRVRIDELMSVIWNQEIVQPITSTDLGSTRVTKLWFILSVIHEDDSLILRLGIQIRKEKELMVWYCPEQSRNGACVQYVCCALCLWMDQFSVRI